MKTNNVLITGNSSGLGLGFTREYLESGWQVFGLSRRGCPLTATNLHDQRCDIGNLESIAPALEQLVGQTGNFDLIILNAGILGEIKEIRHTTQGEIDRIMRINVWANKVILDWVINSGIYCRQIVLISSGAAVNGNKGWGGYSLSKATLNMLTRLYAHELRGTHLSALAPGLIDTAMQDYLCNPAMADVTKYPTLENLRNARGTDAMPSADQAARNIIGLINKLVDYPSGSFLDIRTMEGRG